MQIVKVCMRCGCAMTTDTRVTDPEGRPYESVEYDTQKYVEALTNYRNGGV